jgi:Asparaginase, N-terminal
VTVTVSQGVAALNNACVLLQTGLRKPIVLTGSQLPLAMPRSDARQNLIDSVTCLTSFFSPPHIRLEEVAVCFGGRLMRGNRCQKVHSSFYQAFDSLNYPYLANLGVDVDWNQSAMLKVSGVYRPRFEVRLSCYLWTSMCRISVATADAWQLQVSEVVLWHQCINALSPMCTRATQCVKI